MSVGFSGNDLARGPWRSGRGGSQTGVGGGVNGAAEMDVVTHSFRRLGYRGAERHQWWNRDVGLSEGLFLR